MPCDRDLATYVVSNGYASFGSTGSMFIGPFPATAPPAAIQVLEYPGGPALWCLGGSTPTLEQRRCQITVRDIRDNYDTALTLAQNIFNLLDNLGNTTGMTSGARYLHIRGLQQPTPLGEDENGRIQFVFNLEIRKERG